jgi:hypothetical protein
VISWIVASHDRGVLASNLLPSLDPDGSTNDDAWHVHRDDDGIETEVRGLHGVAQGDELVVVREASSIAQAYRAGQAQATRPVRCYVHHDVQITNLPALRNLLMAVCLPDVGMVGVVGSRDPRVPWWDGDKVGTVRDSRLGLLNFGQGGTTCSYLDGLLLATRHDLTWDTGIPGWHLYDHDICQQQLAEGRPNYCLPHGSDLVVHNTTGSTDVTKLAGWAEGVEAFRTKWDHRQRPLPG